MRRSVPTLYYSVVRRFYRVLTIVLLAGVFATNVYRAATQSIAHDEALTYHLFVAAPWQFVFNAYDANHHVLHTILCKVSVKLFGLSAFSDVYTSFAGGPGQVGLHGTNDPSGLGRDVSHGCVRVTNEAITALAQQLPMGTPISIVA